MQKEMDGHTKTGTFSMIDVVPEGRKPVSSKWVLAWKINELGLITDFKARLLARGFSQIHGMDYQDCVGRSQRERFACLPLGYQAGIHPC